MEAAIPFTSIRYKKGLKKWGINFSRLDLKTSEKSSWAPVPRQFPTASLGYAGVLVWDNPPPDQTGNISVIPYSLVNVTKNYEQDKTIFKKKFGSDLKIGITSSLNLDLTINPDFSQVEVDQQVINLNRYELFFPERRQFFIENADLLGDFGYSTIRPFFSRRIGLNEPVIGGVKLSGSIDQNWRLSVMDVQTKENESNGTKQNFAVFALQRSLFARSNIKVLFVNKQVNDHPSISDTTKKYNKFNRNIGIEYNLNSVNNFWKGKALIIKSFTPTNPGKDFVEAANIEYTNRYWNIFVQEESVGKNYIAEAGYVPRTSYFKINPLIKRLFFPAHGFLLSYGPEISWVRFFNDAFHRTDDVFNFTSLFNFRDISTLKLSAFNNYVRLLMPFDPTNSGKDSLQEGTEHNWSTVQMEFISKPQKLLTYSLISSYGGYYANSTKFNAEATVGYRFQPYISLSLNLAYNKLDLPAPWNRSDFWLIGTKFDITLSKKIFLYTFCQYNQQLNNFNINGRFQWRYNPASDLFVVYSDNYVPVSFIKKDRSITIKMTYWWNK